MLEMLLSAWTMNKADFVGWVLKPTQEVVALSTSASAWVTSDPPYLATKRNLVKPNIDPACFVAGTLVHTKEGLRPIEEIKVGDWVLSKPENGEGKQAYKRVTQTFVHEDREVILLEIARVSELRWTPNRESWSSSIVGTANHPFFVKDRGWVQLVSLEGHDSFVTNDNVEYVITGSVDGIRATEIEGVGWCPTGDGTGFNVYFQSNSFNVDYSETYDDYADFIEGGLIERTVYNIEVEDFHTYFVGSVGPDKTGILVHNKNPYDIATIQKVSENGLVASDGVPVFETKDVKNLLSQGQVRGVIIENEGSQFAARVGWAEA